MRRALLLFAFLLALRPVDGPAADLLIGDVTLIDGSGAAPRPHSAVVVRGDRIVAAGPVESIGLPPGATVVDGRGRYLIPGLWDMHVHVLREGRPEAYFPLLVANGVTGVRDMGGNFDFERIARLKAEIASGARIGPRFVAPGPIVDGPYPQLKSISVVVSDAVTARAQVDRLHDSGADFVKVYNRVPRDAYFAIADEARRKGIPFAGHIPMEISAREASDAGQASVEHLFNVLFACSDRDAELMRRKQEAMAGGLAGDRRRLRRSYLHGVLDSYSAARCEELFAHFVRNRTWMTPTLVQRKAFSVPNDGLVQDPLRRYIPLSVRALWDPRQDDRIAAREDEDRDLERQFYERDRALIAPMLRAGVGFLAGTDGGDVYSIPGFSLHDELAMLVEAGLTPMDALQSATRNAGIFLRMPDVGVVAPGNAADLVLLDADPLADIRNTRAIRAVVLHGRYLDRAALDRMLTDAAAAAERS